MESKIFIDINYSSREPQIVIHQRDSEDPRDKLVSMLTGQAMPGEAEGYCKIERYPTQGMIVITPVDPLEMVKHITTIAKLAENNQAIDTSGIRERYRAIIESEYDRVVPRTKAQPSPLNPADEWAAKNLPHPLYKRWTDEVMYPEKKQSTSQE